MAQALSFATWKDLLRKDCAAHENLAAFESLSDTLLLLFYEDAVDPTVQGLVTSPPAHDGSNRSHP